MKALGIIIGILGFLLLITFHEWGHFMAAKMVGVSVNEFSVGMGPLIWQKEKNDTMYSIRALPIGGYCALEGEEEESDNPKSFSKAGFLKKFVILVAGSFNNLLLGLIILLCVYGYIASGLETKIGFLRVLEVAWNDFIGIAGMIFSFLGGFFNGSSSVNDLSGVVGIVGVISETAEVGLENVFYLVGILSVNVGVVNLLPFPALDGGRILLELVNTISGKKISDKVQGIINGVGMVLLLALMVFLIFKDSISLIRG